MSASLHGLFFRHQNPTRPRSIPNSEKPSPGTAMSAVDATHRQTRGGIDQTSENTPLLNQRANQHGIRDPGDPAAAAAPLSHVVPYFMAIHFLLAFCELILVAPLIKLFEQSLCISYYGAHDPSVLGPGGDVPEALCKIQAVQAPLATIRGWKSMFDTIPG